MANWDFSGDEALFFFLSAALGVVWALRWYVIVFRATPIGDRGWQRWLLALTPIFCIVILWIVLRNWSDPVAVAGHIDYELLFVAGGLALLAITGWFTSALLGISWRDDALERDNVAAAVTVSGTMLGVTALYAQSNMGAGPTIWTTIFPAAVGLIALLAMWLLLEPIAHISETITIDRDVAFALRHAAWLVATGLIIGRAAAGDWHDWPSTYGDMLRLGWPSLALAAFAAVSHRMLRPTPHNPHPSVLTAGLIPALILIGIAIGYLAALGPPEVGKHVITYEQYTGEQ